MPRVLKTIRRFVIKIIAVYCAIVLALAVLYYVVPPVSTLMLARLATLQGFSYKPVPLGQISPHLVRTVLRAEDSRFCLHYGVNWQSLGTAVEKAYEDEPSHGASTIAMQVTKNLFLWPQQSYIRKAIEIPMAMGLNLLWPKKRMLEIYLSIAEWGDGVFGAEAAAQKYFGKPAKHLTRQEAALLAAALPNPKERNPQHPSAYHARYAGNLARWANEDMDMSCLR